MDEKSLIQSMMLFSSELNRPFGHAQISTLMQRLQASISLEYCTVPVFMGPRTTLLLWGDLLAQSHCLFAALAPASVLA
jgi:hypothetical protein